MALEGKILLTTGETSRAIDALSRALGLDDRIWSAQRDLYEALMLDGRLVAAQKHAELAHSLKSDAPATHTLLYMVLARRQKYAAAFAELDEIIRLFGSTPVGRQARSERERLVQFLRRNK